MGEPNLLTETSLFDKIKGIVTTLLFLFSSVFGSFYILAPLLPLMFINHVAWRKIIDRLIGFWIFMPAGIIEFIFGVRITATGTKIDHSEPSLIIMNHRTCLDWLFFWNVLIRMDPWLLTSQKISLKSIVKYLPGAGWSMECGAYLFLDRSFDQDQRRIDALIDYYVSCGYNYQLLLFPEGTDKCKRATERSRIFAEKKGLVHYAYVLHPKLTGFAFSVNKMRKVGYIKNIYDVTVAYADSIVQSELALLLKGACPKNVHFDIRKHDVASLPASDVELSQWLIDLWAKKEIRLSNFYSEECLSKRRLDTVDGAEIFLLKDSVRCFIIFVMFCWIILIILWSYIFFTYPSQFLLGFFTFLVFFGAQICFGGMEWIAARIVGNKCKET